MKFVEKSSAVLAAGLAAAVAWQPGGASAQGADGISGFNPQDNCAVAFERTNDLGKVMIAAWAYGYLAASQGDLAPVDIANAKTIVNNMIRVCAANRQLSLLEMVSMSRKPGAEVPGSEMNGEAFLRAFLEPGADLAALTARLKPTPEDIRAVYNEPLASLLIEKVIPMFAPGVKIGPREGQSELWVSRATTDQLIEGAAVRRDFPGGYEKVFAYMKPGVPIMVFKFRKPGEELGLAFDGLVFVNGRWVLIPKPWRAMQ